MVIMADFTIAGCNVRQETRNRRKEKERKKKKKKEGEGEEHTSIPMRVSVVALMVVRSLPSETPAVAKETPTMPCPARYCAVSVAVHWRTPRSARTHTRWFYGQVWKAIGQESGRVAGKRENGTGVLPC